MNLTKRQISERIEKTKFLSLASNKRWSAARSLVLETLLKQNIPRTAYELMELISKNSKQTILPASIFRILESLCSLSIVFRIDRTKSFIANDNIDENPCFLLVCEKCSATNTVYDQKLKNLLDQTLFQNGFTIENQMIELNGKCISCVTAKS